MLLVQRYCYIIDNWGVRFQSTGRTVLVIPFSYSNSIEKILFLIIYSIFCRYMVHALSSIRELADMLQENKRAAKVLQPAAMKGSSSSGNSSNLSPPPHPQLGYGLVVPWQAIDKLLHDSTRHAGPRGGARSTSSIRHQDDHLLPPLHVVVLLRDPFFWVLSQVKKLALRSDASRLSKDGLKCTNIHQRGTALCPITSWVLLF